MFEKKWVKEELKQLKRLQIVSPLDVELLLVIVLVMSYSIIQIVLSRVSWFP